MTTITSVPAILTIPGNNDRKTFKEKPLRELADSIQENGLIQPITVRSVARLEASEHSKNGKVCRLCVKETNLAKCEHTADNIYEIVAGERRFRACTTLLNWEHVPAIVRDLDDAAASAIMLIENFHREDLDPMEQAQALGDRFDDGDSVEELSEKYKLDTAFITKRLMLLDLIPEAQCLVAAGQIPAIRNDTQGLQHAEIMSKLSPSGQKEAMRLLSRSHALLVLRTFKRFVYNLLDAEKAKNSLFDLTDFWIQQVNDLDAVWHYNGTQAVIDFPVATDLPIPVTKKKHDNAGAIMHRYIRILLEQGKDREAEVIGTVFKALVRSRKVKTPSPKERTLYNDLD